MMKTIQRLLLILTLVCSWAGGTTTGFAENPATPADEAVPAIERSLHCRDCHSLEVPTAREPGLKPCPRTGIITLQHSPATAPEFIPLNQAARQYVPIQFSHRKHAEMAQMTGGCANCHHYNKWSAIQACRSCHAENRQREDLSRPDLKGAYHRLCADCHQSFSNARDCHFCHAAKDTPVNRVPERKQTRVPPPAKIYYQTEFDDGKYVTFTHEAHIRDYEIGCADCHTRDNCRTCHSSTPVEGSPGSLTRTTARPEELHHQPCFTCHGDDDCSRCHTPEPPARP